MTPRSSASARRGRVLMRRIDRTLTERNIVVPTVLALLGLVLVVLIALWPHVWPISALSLPLLLAHVYLPPRLLIRFVIFCFVLLLVALLAQPGFGTATLVRSLVILALGAVVLIASSHRSTLGVAGAKSEAMFSDLRERIAVQNKVPVPPSDWSVESATRAAGGAPFNGDFLVSARVGGLLQCAVVDVSGKGTEAGVRSLQLSAALGSLIRSLPPAQFLDAANQYLCDQAWEEGFATAVHLSLDLTTGDYDLRSAGHLPALHWQAGNGRWRAVESHGAALGLLRESEYAEVHGVLRPGDALLLYTDGVVERAGDDIGRGIDRLLGQAERELARGFSGLPDRLIDVRGSDDDRTLVLLHRY